MRGQNERVDVMSEKTIYQACVDAMNEVQGENEGMASPEHIVTTVLQAVIDLTQSPRTVDELTRILNGGAVDGVGRGLTEDGEDKTPALMGEAVGAYEPGFFERMEVLKMCGGDAIRAETAWVWLNHTEASDVRS